MNKTILISIFVVVMVAAGAIYFLRYAGGNQDISPNINIPESGGAVKTREVAVVNFSFDPSAIDVNKGDNVIWTNQDSAPHQISWDGFKGSVFNKGQSFNFTFEEIGTYDYICPLHPYMKGQIIVK